MIASWRGYENMVEALLKRGANVHRSRYRDSSALMLAAETDNVKTIKLLLQAGANPNIQAMSFHAGEITPLILTINRKNEHSIEIAEALIAAGAKINPTGKFLISPLMHAVDDLEMVKLLIARGANVDQRNFRGSTALMMAALDGKATVVKYLLEKGADINARDDEGNTALKYAEERRALLFPEERDEILRILKR